MLKHVHDLKTEIREKGWWERETPEVSQTSFLRGEDCDAELGFKFEGDIMKYSIECLKLCSRVFSMVW